MSIYTPNINSTSNLDKCDAMTHHASSDTKKTTYRITLNFSDGITKIFDVQQDKSILDEAIKSGIPLLHQCRSGICSSCMCNLNDGEVSAINGTSSTLLRDEYDLGYRLLCISKAESDCTIDLAYASDVGSQKIEQVKAFIDSIETIATNTVRLNVELAEGSNIEFRPGQYLRIDVPGVGSARSYSPSSTKKSLPIIEFLIRLIPGGEMSAYLAERAEVDQVLSLSGPYGTFFFREEHKRSPHIFVAGGTGLAPILSIIDTIRQSSGIKPKMLLSFGCATPDGLFSLDEIQLRKQWMPSLESRVSVDRGAEEIYYSGNPVSPLQQADVTDPNTVAYLCGPQPMIDFATSRLIALGVRTENIFSEQFVASN
jgi:benzoate/toluate 1,2-dioxygenase reductase subunit